jgi:uncharacterized protein YwqG
MSDKRVLDVIHHLARETDTPAVVVDAVVRRLLPSIRLVPQPLKAEDERVGGCRIGGAPDLPAKVEWPRLSAAVGEPMPEDFPDDPLPFLLQVNLAEVAPVDVGRALPKAGMLYFFFRLDLDEEEEDSYILFSRSRGPLRRVAVPPDMPADQRFRERALLPRLEWTVPSPADTGLAEELVNQHLELWEELEERVAEAQGLAYYPNGRSPVHRLLGHPRLIQTPGLADGTKLLLQVDSDREIGMMWGDAGTVYYLITDEELRSHKLAHEPWAMFQSH